MPRRRVIVIEDAPDAAAVVDDVAALAAGTARDLRRQSRACKRDGGGKACEPYGNVADTLDAFAARLRERCGIDEADGEAR